MTKVRIFFSIVVMLSIVAFFDCSNKTAEPIFKSREILTERGLQKTNSIKQKSGQKVTPVITEAQVVIINDGFRYIEIENGQISLKKTGDTGFKNNVYLCGSRVFPMSWDVTLRHLHEMTAKSRLSIKDEKLYFDKKQINLQNGLKMREIWEAISWHGWIICLGRTSATDEAANMRPPFVSNELLTFRIDQNNAHVCTLSAFAPADEGGFILLDEIPCK
jgi:hypothetical protein